MSEHHDPKEAVQEQFSRNAMKYVQSQSHAKGADLQAMIGWLQPQPHWRVLDIATGGGHVAKALSSHVETVVATDLTRPMLAAAAQHHQEHGCTNMLYVVADAEELPFLDTSFDAVTCRIAPHHFPHPDRFIQEVSRVLKKDGLFLLIDNVAPEREDLGVYMNTVEKMRDESHVRCLPVSEWQQYAAQNGLQEEFSEFSRKKHNFPIWVAMTATSPEQMERVEAFLLAADEAKQTYFSVVIENGRVASMQIDEWRAVFKKV